MAATSQKEIENVFTWAKSVDWVTYQNNNNVRVKLEELRGIIRAQEDSNSDESSESDEEGTTSESKGADEDENETRIKLVVVGDGAVGKTSLLISFSTGVFPSEYVPTVFENYACKTECEKLPIRLHLWDTAGQEDYDRLRPLSYPGSDVVLLIFATTSKLSFDSIENKWHPEISHYLPRVPFILVGSKIDIRDQQLQDPNAEKTVYVTKEEGKKLAEEIGAEAYLELSSKTCQGLKEAFQFAMRIVLEERNLLKPPTPAAAAPTPASSSAPAASSSGAAPAPTTTTAPVERNTKKPKPEKKGGCILL